jgi:ferrous-iron efflux pump FieF
MTTPYSSPHELLLRRATQASVAVASGLILLKLGAYLLTNSVALLSTLLDSLLDVASSLINLMAVRYALMPPDQEHRFGHGKAEALAGLAQSAFITGSAVFLFIEAISRLTHANTIAHEGIGIAVMLVSAGITLLLVLYQRKVIRQTGSVVIQSDLLHYSSDILANLGVLLALALNFYYPLPYMDSLVAILIAIYILYSAWGIAVQSIDQAMDRELPETERERIKALALAHPEVADLHDLRTRMAGPTTFIQFHLNMPGNLTLVQAHHISAEVVAEITRAYPNAEIIIHEDPQEAVGHMQVA